ncbi:hypothetical protein D3C73_1377590 [compost metagenome]
MKINFIDCENKTVPQVYITKEEIDDKNVINELKRLKSHYGKVALYVSGVDNINGSFKDILQNKI